MGFYYEQKPAEPGRPEQPGCLDALVVTRVVLQVLFWPIAAIFLVVLDLAVIFVLFAVHPALALIPVVATAIMVVLVARWDRGRSPPGDVP